jgi:DNA-binding response OmpR family regulator
MRVLVVEDNPKLGPMLVRGLEQEGHVAELAADGQQALVACATTRYDAIVLDLMLPGIDGLTVLDRLRHGADDTPVLVLTARDDLDDRVDGLDRGADDYLVKPFAFDELLARLRALVRRAKGAGASAVLRVADLEIDTAAKSARRAGRSIALSSREYAVLECLALRRGRIVSRDTLLETIYDGDEMPESNVVEVYIGALRRKIDRDHEVKLIRTRRGLGYVFGDDA